MNNQTLSHAMPVYNAALYVSQAFENLLVQTVLVFKLIMVNDCCTYQSISVIKELWDQKTGILRNGLNSGIVFMRNY